MGFGLGKALSIGASLIGGMSGANAAKGAASAGNAGLDSAMKELKRANYQTRADNIPYTTLGSGSANQLKYLLGLDFGEEAPTKEAVVQAAYDELYAKALGNAKKFRGLERARFNQYAEELYQSKLADYNKRKSEYEAKRNDPTFGSLLKSFSQDDLKKDVVYNTGLDFGLNTGLKSINNRASAMGAFDNGATLRAITQWANDYGSTKAGEAQQRFMGDKGFTLNALMGGSGVGQNAVNTNTNAGLTIGQALAGAQNARGVNNAAAITGANNSWGNAVGNIAKTVGTLFV